MTRVRLDPVALVVSVGVALLALYLDTSVAGAFAVIAAFNIWRAVW